MEIRVKQLNLPALFEAHRSEILEAITRVCETSSFIGGSDLKKFEKDFAGWVGEGLFALGCANGTDAITLAALSLKLPAGSEAIVPAMTYLATVEGLENAGLTVRLVDIDPGTWLLDSRLIGASLTNQTRLIVPVHLYGQMADMDAVSQIAQKNNCRVLEDASQAHGAKWNGRSVGHFSDFATFSFYPGKNLGAFGDAGAILSRHQNLIEISRLLANHGSRVKYEHEIPGWNSRLDNLQAAVLNVKLKYLSEWNDKRRLVAKFYDESLKGIKSVTLPTVRKEAFHVYHQYVIAVENREKFLERMKEKGVEVGIHYPKALHQLPAYKKWSQLSFPCAEKLAAQGVSLPMCPTLKASELDIVVKAIYDYSRSL
jgi:dTDP-4-amino-4,6-dideoxygalactose transaminase